jgi:energy-coupling factor transporter ATP-binding protein EcfA2
MDAAEPTTNEADEQSWDLSFTAVELKESAALGADVQLDLDPCTTVLVGKNGAGKSILLEKMYAGIHGAAGVVQTPEPDPAYFACEVDVASRHIPGNVVRLRYECHWRPRDEPEHPGTAAQRIMADADLRVEESCWIPGDKDQLLWRVDDGVVTYNNGERGVIATGRTLLNWTISRPRRSGTYLFPEMAYPLRELFDSVVQVPAGIPRSNNVREELAVPYPQSYRRRDIVEPRRVVWMAYRLADWHETSPPLFEEFVEVGRRIGLLEDVKVKVYRDPDANTGTHRRDLVSVLFDGTDLGLLSDGTLRVAEILIWLIFPSAKRLLIEEPETAVHPGLLVKLLAEIDAYSSDCQIILSTQSPHVVSWADPRAIRLVERHAGRTEVRSLCEDEIGRVSAYLHDEGTLGDFVYSGALDG